MYKLLPLLLLMQSCQYGAGIAVRPVEFDNRRIDNMSNPVGVIRVENNVGSLQFYAEHLSSIPDTREDYGINLFGINYMFGSK